MNKGKNPDKTKKVMEMVDLLMAYDKGLLDREETVNRFCHITGLSPDIAEDMVPKIRKSNVLKFPIKKKKKGGLR